MSERPGIMIYYDLRPALNFLSKEEKGILLDAMLDYAELGVVPEFTGMCGMAWAIIRPKLDRDRANYASKCEKMRYAAYCRECKRVGYTPASFEEWKNNT